MNGLFRRKCGAVRTKLEAAACLTIAATPGKQDCGITRRGLGVASTSRRAAFFQPRHPSHMIVVWVFLIGKLSGQLARCPGAVSIFPRDALHRSHIPLCSTAMLVTPTGKWR